MEEVQRQLTSFNWPLTGATSIHCSGTITAPTFSGNAISASFATSSTSATSTNNWYPNTGIWFNDVNGRPRFHFVNNGVRSHTIIT